MIVAQQIVSGDTSYTIQLQGNTSLVTFDFHNDSPFNVAISLGTNVGLQQAEFYMSPHSILYGISAPTSKYSIGKSRFQGPIYLYTQTPIGGAANVGNAPAQSVTILGYQAGQAPQATATLSRLQNIGNSTPVSTSLSSVNNDGNGQLVFVESTPSGAASSTISIDTYGNLTVKGFNGSTLTTLLQLIAGASPKVILAAASVLTQILGNASIGGNLSVTGTTSLDNGDITTDGFGRLLLNPLTTSVNPPTGTGTITFYQFFTGTFKLLLVYYNNVQNTSVTQYSLGIPAPFTVGTILISSNIPSTDIMGGGNAKQVAILTALAVGGGTTTNNTTMPTKSIGFCFAGIDTLRFAASDTSARTGFLLAIGI